MRVTRLCLHIGALIIALVAVAYLYACVASAQSVTEQHDLKPDVRRALKSRTRDSVASSRKDGYQPLHNKYSLPARTGAARSAAMRAPERQQLRAARSSSGQVDEASSSSSAAISTRIRAGTPLSRVLHTSQLSITSLAGTVEQFADRTGDLVADERTMFDARGGAFDIAVGRSGARYEVYSAINDNGTPANPRDDYPTGVIVVALDTNGDFVRDSSSTFDLERDFRLPSAVAVVSGISNAGREFVVVSSSGYYNHDDPRDPDNEPSAGVVLLVRDTLTGGFDRSFSRELVRVGSNQINNANALALLPNNNLLIADFDSNELRVVRDTNADGMPDTLDTRPFYAYQFSDDAPLDIAVNSRGIVFSHSVGNDTLMLALYDDNRDGYADADEVVVEGLSIDNNLIFHGLTIDREGTVYVIEDASGAADTIASGGNGGTPSIDAFPDPSLDGFLLDGSLYAVADGAGANALSGLAFGVDLSPPLNLIDVTQYFVRQHYRDFLNREPDRGGLLYWSAQINACEADAACIHARRIGVSAAYFIEQEFQVTGSFVYRMHKASYGSRPAYAQFTSDRSRIVAGPGLEASRQAFANEWVGRAAFRQFYPETLTPEQFIERLFDTANLRPYTAERQRLANEMRAGRTRAQVLREVIEIAEFREREYNPSFVLMQYFGYLRRNPDQGGYAFWLNVLNNREPGNYRGMVCAFLTSAEYQLRFGTRVTRTDAACGR